MMSATTKSILVRYREKGGQLKFEIISGTDAELESTLDNYLETKDPHSLMILGEVGTSTQLEGTTNIVTSRDMHDYLQNEGRAWIVNILIWADS